MRHYQSGFILGLTLFAHTTLSTAAWQPPIGIPAPDFGITEVAPAQPMEWPETEVPGFYYVDNTHINATDTANPYGTPDKPRMTILTSSYGPGSYVELSGGPYSDNYLLNFNCTVSQPCWFRGNSQSDMPIFNGRIDIRNSEYLVVENIDFNGGAGGPVRINTTDGENSHHLTVRHSNIRNRAFIGSSSGVSIIPWYNSNMNDIVIYNNEINTLGDYQATEDTDFHGITPSLWGRNPSSTLSRIWILDNHCYHISGNCTQVNAGNWDYSHEYLTHVYIGRNVSHDGRQGAFGIKQSSHVIISQNTMYSADMVGSQSGDGVGTQYGPDNLWILFNQVYDTPYGVRQTDTSTEGGVAEHNTYIIGNLFHDLKEIPDAEPAWTSLPGWGISLWKGVLSRHIVNNTFYNTVGGVLAIANGPVHLNNNIFNSINLAHSSTSHISISHPGRAGLSSQDGNTFDIAASFRWWNSERPEDNLPRGESFTLLDYTTNYPTQCTTCEENVDPLFVDPTNANFRLQASSPLINNSSEHPVYQTFFDLYGIDIRVDFDGNARPSGSGWEAGAFEFYDPSTINPTITTSSLYDATVATAYTTTLRGYGGTTPYAWALEGGALPAGLTLVADGTISGTPTEDGNFTIDVKVMDQTNAAHVKTLSISVIGAEVAAVNNTSNGNTSSLSPTTNNNTTDNNATDNGGGGLLWGLNIWLLLLASGRVRTVLQLS